MKFNDIDELTHEVIGLAIKIHKKLGTGLLESVYQGALECKAVKELAPIDQAQAITPSKLSGAKSALLVNFHSIFSERSAPNP